MKRRKFVQSLLAAPAVPAALGASQAPPPAAAPKQQPEPKANTPARQEPRQPPSVPHLDLTEVDVTAEPAPHFFTPAQFATLRKLGAILMPPLKNNPGALDAQAPEFIDFLIGVSPAERQKSYQFGLDQLEAQAKSKYGKSFCDVDDAQAGAILRPLLVPRFWPEDLPSDPLQAFVAQVHEDLRTATMNSREWAAASEKSGHHFTRGFRGSGYYWFPIDPISQG
jgi:hypothetical protein